MERTRYRSRSDPKNKSRSRVWHRKPAVQAKPKSTPRSGTFINIGQEMKHGRGPRK
jgi:hypothetical protein